jgi:hypothetical protein
MNTFATFNDAILSASTTALHNFVLPSICVWLQSNKNITVTPTELAGALQLQAPTRNIVVGTASPIVAPVPATGGGGRKKANTGTPEVVPPGQGCIRVPKNGPTEKRGIACNKPRMDGKMYCKNCNFLKSGGGESKNGVTVAKAPTGLIAPTTDLAPTVVVEEEEIRASQPAKFPGYYLETVCRLLFKTIGDDYIFYAKLSDDDSKIIRLSETDRTYAKAKGMKEATKVDEDREYDTLSAICKPVVNGFQAVPTFNVGQPATYTPQPATYAPQNGVPNFSTVATPAFTTPNYGVPQNYGAMPNTGVYNPNIPNFAPIANIATIPNIATGTY